ncbi:MAG: DUF4258 domain-containing protein, partial [Planctomycetes bacterium]|nr:DUF4258 domain-containing protein [Planctomycetota bacterium]
GCNARPNCGILGPLRVEALMREPIANNPSTGAAPDSPLTTTPGSIYELLSVHGWQRMCSRGLSTDEVDAVLAYGRVARVRGAVIHAVGRKEVERARRVGVDLSRAEGLHVLCAPNGVIVTVYRNHDFRGLRPGRRGRSSRRRSA